VNVGSKRVQQSSEDLAGGASSTHEQTSHRRSRPCEHLSKLSSPVWGFSHTILTIKALTRSLSLTAPFGSRCYQATVATVHKKIMDLMSLEIRCWGKTCLSCETWEASANFFG
jgi:hypothetical protein